MTAPLVWFDESGNTGDDLLNSDQPVFALASVALNECQAEEVLAPVRAASNADELKFARLRKRGRSRDAVLQSLRSDHLNTSTVRIAVVDKPYMLVAKMCDILMEPGWVARGLSWHADDNPFKWPLTLHEHAPRVLGRDRWLRIRNAFVAAVREPSEMRAVAVAYEILQALSFMEEHDLEDARVKFPLEVMFEQAPSELQHYADDALDPALPCLVEQIAWWSGEIGEFAVVHDHTDTIDRNIATIMALCDPKMEPHSQTFGDRTISYPLRATEIKLAASDDSPALQLADLLAGACAFQQAAAGSGGNAGEFANAIAATRIRRLFGQFVASQAFVLRTMDLNELS